MVILFFLDFLTFEDGTNTLSRNVSKDYHSTYSSWTSWPLKMGPIRCPETSVKITIQLFFLDFLTLEDGTDTVSRNITKGFPLNLSYWTSWPLKMEPICGPKTSVKDCHSMLHNTPEQRRSQCVSGSKL
jgi:hypothetical protein